MSDLETRLTEGLAGVAERAPAQADLAAGARVRLRRRRRTATAAVAAALAVAAIPVGLAVVGNEPDRRDTTVAEPVPDDWRVETWRDLSVRVPPDWRWGTGTDWCRTDESAATATPVVSRPGVVDRALGCAPSYGFGVHFVEASGGELPPGTEGVVQQYRGRRYPYGAWLGYASTGWSAMWVVTDSRTLTRQVLDSADPVGEVDAHGCATRIEMTAPSGSERMSVCRYDGDGWLEKSELLSPADSESALDAFAAAPGASCEQPLPGRPVVTVQSEGVGFHVVLDRRCAVISDDAGTLKQVTPEVLHWVLSPGWSGALPFLSPTEADSVRLRTG